MCARIGHDGPTHRQPSPSAGHAARSRRAPSPGCCLARWTAAAPHLRHMTAMAEHPVAMKHVCRCDAVDARLASDSVLDSVSTQCQAASLIAVHNTIICTTCQKSPYRCLTIMEHVHNTHCAMSAQEPAAPGTAELCKPTEQLHPPAASAAGVRRGASRCASCLSIFTRLRM